MADTWRRGILQTLLSLNESSTYLEIGVARGVALEAVKADRKVGVDPRYKFDAAALAATDWTATLHTMTSE